MTGSLLLIKRTVLERFEEKFIPEPNSGCWIWIGATDQRGYGRFGWSEDGVKIEGIATRASLRLYRGMAAGELYVCHKCDVASCVNPDHLFLATHAENMRDMVSKGRHNGRPDLRKKTHCLNGHPFSGENLRMYNNSRRCRICLTARVAKSRAKKRENAMRITPMGEK